MSSSGAWAVFTVVVWFFLVVWICMPDRGDD